MTTTRVDDRDGVEAQLRAVEPMVRGICRARLGHADGDDTAQLALLRLWRKLQGHEITCLPSYAALCARYAAITAVRDLHRRPTPAGEVGELWWVDPDPDPAEQAERADDVREAAARVATLMRQLRPREVEVMRASVLAGRSNAEAAALLGVAASTMRSSQVRAMARLREACGTRSPNPLASNIPYAQRRRNGRARRAERIAALAGSVEAAAGWS